MHQKIHVPVSLTKQLNTNSSNQILNILSSQQFCSLSALTFQYGEMSIKNGHIYITADDWPYITADDCGLIS